MKKNTLSLSANARLVLEKRYLKKDDSGNPIESPEDMFRRIAENAASADLIYNKKADIISLEEQFYDLMASLQFLPNSPHINECKQEPAAVTCLFCITGGRLYRKYLRNGKAGCFNP